MNDVNYSSALLPKRKRLSYACNYCRSKKIRCDERFPSCRNCQLAGIPCITVNKKRPNEIVQQRRKDLPPTEAPGATALVSPETTGVSPYPSQGAAESTSPIPRDSHEWSTTDWDTQHLPVMPTRAGSSVVQISTQWLDLALSRLRMPRTDSVRVNLIPCLSSPSTGSDYAVPSGEPTMPPLDELHRYTELFFKIYHPVYPFLDRQKMVSLFSGLVDTAQHCNGANTGDSKLSRLMLLYLITILGSMASPPVSPQRLNTYLAYCHTLVGHLILHPTLESVQALLQFAITLRLRDQLSQAWDILTLAVSMAQTLRLADRCAYRHSTCENESVNDDTESLHTWWALYTFRKLLAFDYGRKSDLDDPTLSFLGRQAQAEPPGHRAMPKLQEYQVHMTGLANILHEMQHRSWHTWRKERLDATSDAEARASKIRAAGAIDTLLWEWRGSLPEYQVGPISATNSQLMPRWAFLLFYYQQAIIVLYRNTLMLDWNELRREVDQYGSGEVWHPRLRNGPQICLEAAQGMTNLHAMATEASEPSFLSLATSPLAAAYALAVYISRRPASILSRTHFELMKVAVTILRRRHSSDATGYPLHRALDTLEQYVAQLLADTPGHSSVELHPESVENHPTTMLIPSAALSDPLEPLVPSWGTLEWLGWDWNELFPQ